MIAIELFFVVNLVMDYYILYLSLGWLDVCRIRPLRLLASASIGSAYACAALGFAKWALIPPIPFLAAFPMIWIAVGRKPLRTVLRGSLFMLAAAFLSAGTVYAMQRAIPGVSFLILMLVSGLVIGLAALALGRNKKRALWVKGEVRFRFGEIQGTFDAAIDSGNHAVDAISGLPVIIAPLQVIARSFGMSESELSPENLPLGFHAMALRTVAGTRLAVVFTPDVVTWNAREVRCAIAVSPHNALAIALAPSCFGDNLSDKDSENIIDAVRRHA